MNEVRLCALEEIPEGEARGFDPLKRGHDQLFLIRRGRHVFAWRNACPHPGYEGTSLPWRKHAYLNKDRSRILCSGHGANFDVETGVCLSGPCMGLALTKMTVRLGDDDQLYWYPNNVQEK